MKFTKGRVSSKPSINITPLVDAVFILLIFFAVSTTFMFKTAIPVNLPEAASAKDFEKSKAVVVTVTAESKIFIGEDELHKDNLNLKMQSLFKLNPEAAVVIQADRNALHGVVISVIDASKLAGFGSFTIATEEP